MFFCFSASLFLCIINILWFTPCSHTCKAHIYSQAGCKNYHANTCLFVDEIWSHVWISIRFKLCIFSGWKMRGESCMAADSLIDTSEWWCQHNWALRLIHSKIMEWIRHRKLVPNFFFGRIRKSLQTPLDCMSCAQSALQQVLCCLYGFSSVTLQAKAKRAPEQKKISVLLWEVCCSHAVAKPSLWCSVC